MGAYYSKDIKVSKIQTYSKSIDDTFKPKTKIIKHWFKKDEIIEGYEWTDHYDYSNTFLTKTAVFERLENAKVRGQVIEINDDGTIKIYNKPHMKVYLSNGDELFMNFKTKEEMQEYINEHYPELREIT